jgi:hypothetical protein
MKSFYTVSLALSGGWYRDSHLTYGALSELQRALEYEFWYDLRNGSQLVLDESVWMETYIDDWLKQKISLRPFITVRAANVPTCTLPEKITLSTLRKQSPFTQLRKLQGDKEFFKSALLYLDWGAVPVMPLKEPTLKSGEAEGKQKYRGQNCQATYRYGYFDNEDGEKGSAKYQRKMDEALAIDPGWLSFNAGTVRALAEAMHATGDYGGMPVLADALQEAGCENELFLWHCRAPACVHARGSWLVERLRGA